MKKAMGKKLFLNIGVIVILIISLAVTAGAGNNDRKLFGDYSANFILSCGTCSGNFTTPFPMAPFCNSPAISTTYTWNVQGIYAFDGGGGVEFTGRYLGVLREPLSGFIPVVLPPKLKCESGIYTVKDDLTVAIGFDSCFVYGDELGTTPIHRIDNVNLGGQLLDRMDGPVLLLTDTFDPAFTAPMPNIETVITYPPLSPPPSLTSYRICGLTGTAIPIKEHRMKKR